MNARALLPLLLLWFAGPSTAQVPHISRVDPPFWWTGMRQDTLELLVTGEHLQGAGVSTTSQGIRVLSSGAGAGDSHLFITILVLPGAMEGEYDLSISNPAGSAAFRYSFRPRDPAQGGHAGFGPGDVVYLITPDRFANGDVSNDSVAGMRERPNRAAPYGRHGGDLKGILDHLPYLKDLGVTTLWINPLTENDNPSASYHGYAATDLYHIDPRYGTNDLYCKLVREAHRIGLKVILDHVSNHLSIFHPWIADPPTEEWFNGTRSDHLPPFHELARLNDPHATPGERRKVLDGWFSGGMPDLNLRNPRVRRYLIQNTIWWLELAGIDGIREDTYPYCDRDYMNAWCRTILAEYPRLNIVGEVWMNEPPFTASFQRGNALAPGRNSALPTVTDFPLYEALKATFTRKEGLRPLADCLAMDFCYAAPESLLTFTDNHDVPRLAFLTGTDSRRWAMALTVLLTTRGIPQIYYGTEIALRGGPDHGTLRADMPGGFPGDPRNAFTEEGRTPEERESFRLVRELLQLRRQSPPLQHGELIHFTPLDGVYVYFRILRTSTILVAVNNNESARSVSCARFRELLPEGTRLKQLTGERRGITASGDHVDLDALSATVFQAVRE